jgi:hypothetical protein
MKQSEVFALLKKFVGQSNVLTAPVAFVRYTGSLDCAVFLSQVIYWTDRSEDGWFYKSYSEWEIEICLSEYEIRKNCRLLKNKGILITKLKKVNGAPVVHYRLNEAVFSESILKFLQNPICKDSESNPELVKNAIRTNSTNLDTEKTSESINKDYQRLPSKNTYTDQQRANPRADTRGSRLPDDFCLNSSMREWAVLNTPHVNADDSLVEFVDYWRGVPGQRGKKLDWPATWRNRMRELEGRARRNGNGNGTSQPGTYQTPSERRNAATIRNREREAELRSLGDEPVESILRRESGKAG